jgi:hypothetical protein
VQITSNVCDPLAQAAIDAGALDASITAVRMHLADAALQQSACLALFTIILKANKDTARKQVAADACALGAIVAIMRASCSN